MTPHPPEHPSRHSSVRSGNAPAEAGWRSERGRTPSRQPHVPAGPARSARNRPIIGPERSEDPSERPNQGKPNLARPRTCKAGTFPCARPRHRARPKPDPMDFAGRPEARRSTPVFHTDRRPKAALPVSPDREARWRRLSPATPRSSGRLRSTLVPWTEALGGVPSGASRRSRVREQRRPRRLCSQWKYYDSLRIFVHKVSFIAQLLCDYSTDLPTILDERWRVLGVSSISCGSVGAHPHFWSVLSNGPWLLRLLLKEKRPAWTRAGGQVD